MKTALYRHFDADGSLLYVGVSVNPFSRTAQHKRLAGWFSDVCRIDVEWHESEQDALEAETAAILSEKPAHNISKNSQSAVAHITGCVGVDNMAASLRVSVSAVRNAVGRGKFPPRWYLIVRELCARHDLECPESIFRWKPSLANREATQ